MPIYEYAMLKLIVSLSHCVSHRETWLQEVNIKEDVKNGMPCMCIYMPCYFDVILTLPLRFCPEAKSLE